MYEQVIAGVSQELQDARATRDQAEGKVGGLEAAVAALAPYGREKCEGLEEEVKRLAQVGDKGVP